MLNFIFLFSLFGLLPFHFDPYFPCIVNNLWCFSLLLHIKLLLGNHVFFMGKVAIPAFYNLLFDFPVFCKSINSFTKIFFKDCHIEFWLRMHLTSSP